MSLKKIGILGGMGPEASAQFYQKMIPISQKKYNAVQDTDYPPMVIYSLPLVGFNESGIVDQELVLKQLHQGIKLLNNSGCDFIIMVCNTIHTFIDELQGRSKAPILSIVEGVVKKVKENKIKSVGLLASETTFSSMIYDSILNKNKIHYSLPDSKGKKEITKLIFKIMGGEELMKSKNKVIEIAKEMKCQAVILGCTELPLAINQNDLKMKVYDSMEILAESALEYSHG